MNKQGWIHEFSNGGGATSLSWLKCNICNGNSGQNVCVNKEKEYVINVIFHLVISFLSIDESITHLMYLH